jgi:iron complex transport system substrate-binding protein
MNIVSLLPSATEIVCALGLEDRLVGVSHDCDWPPEVQEDRAVLSAAVVSGEQPSREIDQAVRERLHQGLSVYHLDDELLAKLEPDLILTQELCEVCAPSFDEVQQAARVLHGDVEVVSLEPTSLEDVLDTIRVVGHATGHTDRADDLIARLRTRIDRVRERAGLATDQPRTLAIEWLEPLFVGGHWVPEMIELAGGEAMNVPGEPSEAIDWADVARFDPEAIAVMPCGFAPERTAEELDLLIEHELWPDLKAVKDDRVHVVHGSFYFNRPGPRLVDGVEVLASLMHPEEFGDLELPSDAVYPVASPW